MASDENTGQQPPQNQPGQPAPNQSLINAEVSRRLDHLETSTSDLGNRIFDAHKWFVTIVFSVLAIVVTALGVLSRIEVVSLKADVRDSVAKMERDVQAFIGEARKKPKLEILNDNLPLEGQVIEVRATREQSPEFAGIETLFLKNQGDRRTEPISIIISLAAPFTLYGSHPDWEQAACFDKHYKACFSLKRQVTIAPGDPLNVYPLYISWKVDQTNTTCKIEVSYGGETPAVAHFEIKPKWLPISAFD